ncbi:hypothetical protein WJX73_006572 [Symbiochloris irregularis]|uniref:Mitogen-activated protein kinase n=1 Tax=Symbiochloris irregularis TaxID=706552 RepID=A0AAW1P678_9CHLO
MTSKPPPAGTSSNAPVQKECDIPGKTAWVIWRTPFEIDDKYRPIKAIGKGAYGVVCSAENRQTGEKVAIKKITNAFGHVMDARRTLREVKLLRHLKHVNVMQNRDIMLPSSLTDFQDLYVVSELMDTDLHQIIRSPQALTDDHNQYFLYQMLCGLKYIHSANVLHRDLKPSNLLVNAACSIKICDFGLARTGDADFMTEYVVTRWYRAPELLLSCERYDQGIDVWSVGCILAELFLRKPLFPGKDYLNQLKLIIATLGTPSDQELEFVTAPKARQFIRDMGNLPRVDFQEVFPGISPHAADLLSRMLQFDPRSRITVRQALAHPYLASLHDEAEEPTAPTPFEFTFENEKMTAEDVKERVYAEILHYHPEARGTATANIHVASAGPKAPKLAGIRSGSMRQAAAAPTTS